MHTPLLSRRASRIITGIVLLPVLALLPKCPLCIAVWLSAAGFGAGAAHALASGAVELAKVLVALALCILGAWLGRRVWRAAYAAGFSLWERQMKE
ncbi:hypothetical protein [Pyxidicoccus xibeiensis]|uniref:hypothetical protein n=1 Tax=Pyxidicoccus xibeiensis TaxID=2906759 RepID=UPI0020A74C64|nr:hypothetical protein [Pyxidicoccus xibeiensis]MCP3140074.1 hypothetical protein [Pyxidicoccus xibeiensis]